MLIRLTDMGRKPVYVKADAITMVRRDVTRGDEVMPGGAPCTIVFINDDAEPLEVRTKPGRIAKLVRKATSWVEL